MDWRGFVFLGLTVFLFGALFLFVGGAEKEYDKCYYRDDPLVQRMFDEGLETSEGPESSYSTFPPGTICTWAFADGTVHVQGPSLVPVWSATVGLVTIAAGVTLIIRGNPFSSPPDLAQELPRHG